MYQKPPVEAIPDFVGEYFILDSTLMYEGGLEKFVSNS